MKFFILQIFVLIAAISSEPIGRGITENERNAKIILENSRDNFKCGWPDIGTGIPPIDPFLMDEFTLFQNANGIDTTTTMTNVRLFGLKNFITESFTLHADRRIEYVFKVPYMYMNGTHETKGSMVGIPVVNGKGPMVSHMTNSRYHGVITWTTYPGTEYMHVKDQTMDVTIQSMNMTLSGFGLLDGAVNQQVNDQLPEMIASEQFQRQMNDMFDSFLMPIVDSFIYQQTQATIGDVLAHYALNPRPPQC